MPLQRTLRDVIAPRAGVDKKAPAGPSAPPPVGGQGVDVGKAKDGDGALWLLRQLRPVSYSFRKGMDSKFMRFGFIADELESVVPEVVRRPGDREVTDQKAVVYQDLIALLAAASQSQQKLIESQENKLGSLEKMHSTLVDKLTSLERENEEDKKRQSRRKSRRKAKSAKAAAAPAIVDILNTTNSTNGTNATHFTPTPDGVMCTAECNALNTQKDMNRDLMVIYDSACANGGFGCSVQDANGVFHKMCRYCAFRNFGSHRSAPCPPCATPPGSR